MERWPRALLLLASGVCAPASPAIAGTCALCRQALASGGNPGLIQGFYWSIVLIAGVPLLMLGVIGLIVWRRSRLRRCPQRAQASV